MKNLPGPNIFLYYIIIYCIQNIQNIKYRMHLLFMQNILQHFLRWVFKEKTFQIQKA